MQPDLEGMVRLVDQETNQHMEILAGRDTLNQYQRALTAYLHAVEAFCHGRDMGNLLLTSDLDMEKTVLRELSRAGLIA